MLLALAAVHVYNFMRVDLGALRADAEPILARARQISDRARPEYQDLALATLPPNPHNGPFYRLDDQLREAEVVGGPATVSEVDATIIQAFEFEDPHNQGFVAADGGVPPQLDNGALKVVGHNGSDYLTSAASLAVPRDDVGDILLRARANKKTRLTLAWSKDDRPDNIWKDRLEVTLIGDGQFHSYVINGRDVLKRGLNPGEQLVRLFMRPADISGTDVEIDFLRFLSKRSRYLTAPNGVLYETLGGEMRKVLYMLPEQTLEWLIDVPPGDPGFEFGSGALLDNAPITFQVRVLEGEPVVLHEQTVRSASGWRDVRLDLSAWAGKTVKLQLKVTGNSQNVALWSNPFLHSTPNKRFNVIIVLEDALRADYLSTYGYERETSPNKTALMQARGIQFDWAVSQETKTRPSVPSLMTSLYPTATGVWHFSDRLSERYLTVAEILRAQGFVTASFIQNGNAGPYAGLNQGFDELHDEEIMGQEPEEILGRRVLAWLERHADRNFFLYLHAIDPHGPYEPPEPFDAWQREVSGTGTSVSRDPRLDPQSVREPTVQERQARYAGEILHNDAVLPVLLKKLEDLGLAEDTLLIFLADHGEYLGEHGLWEHQPPGRMPVIHVPLMISYPERFREPKRISEVVQLLDVVPTILELAGVDRSELLLQGDSLVPLIDGQESERWRNRVVISEEAVAMLKQNPCACASIIHREWHLINSVRFWPERGLRYFPDLHAFAKTRVYNFREDPKEEGALLSFAPDLYTRWLALGLISDIQEANMTTQRRLTEGEGVDLTVDPATLERLKGLGYVN